MYPGQCLNVSATPNVKSIQAKNTSFKRTRVSSSTNPKKPEHFCPKPFQRSPTYYENPRFPRREMRSHVLAARYSLQMPSHAKIPDTRHSQKGWGGGGAKLQLTYVPGMVPLFPLVPQNPKRDMHPGMNTKGSPRSTYFSYATVPQGRGRPEATTPSLARTTGPTQNSTPAHPVPRMQGR